MSHKNSLVLVNEVNLFSGPRMKRGPPKAHHFPSLVNTEAVSTFVEKMMSYAMLLNKRLRHFFQKQTKKIWSQIFFYHMQPLLVYPFFV